MLCFKYCKYILWRKKVCHGTELELNCKNMFGYFTEYMMSCLIFLSVKFFIVWSSSSCSLIYHGAPQLSRCNTWVRGMSRALQWWSTNILGQTKFLQLSSWRTQQFRIPTNEFNIYMKKGLRLLCAFFNVYFVEYCVVIIVSDTFKGPKPV